MSYDVSIPLRSSSDHRSWRRPYVLKLLLVQISKSCPKCSLLHDHIIVEMYILTFILLWYVYLIYWPHLTEKNDCWVGLSHWSVWLEIGRSFSLSWNGHSLVVDCYGDFTLLYSIYIFLLLFCFCKNGTKDRNKFSTVQFLLISAVFLSVV